MKEFQNWTQLFIQLQILHTRENINKLKKNNHTDLIHNTKLIAKMKIFKLSASQFP